MSGDDYVWMRVYVRRSTRDVIHDSARLHRKEDMPLKTAADVAGECLDAAAQTGEFNDEGR